MNATALSLWQVRVLAVALAIVGAGIMSLFMTSDAFAANTILVSPYRDTGTANGTIDNIRYGMDENVTSCTYDAADWTINTAGTVNISLISALTCTGSNANLDITITATSLITGGATAPVISYANVGTPDSVGLTSGAMTAKANQTITDGAAPRIKTITYSDADTDAKVDTFLLTYTETTDAASVLSQSELSLTAVGDFTALAFGGAAVTADFADGGTTDTVTLTTESSAEDTNQAATFTISSISSNDNNMSLTDGTNANVTEQAEAQVTFIDAARPMLLTTSPAASAVNVARNASIVLTFSEPITGDATWTMSGGPAVSTFTETGTNALTLAHTDLFSSGYHSVDVTAAADAASNTYNGAVAAISDPFTFTVMASSSSTTSSTAADATYDIDVTSPDGGETLTPGSSHTITWDSTSTGGSAMGFVNINLMYSEDGASTQTTIVTATTNDGSYSWTVPDIDTDGATIQIVGTDLVDALATNESDDTFTIGSVDSTDDTDDEVTVDEEDESTSETTGLSPVTGEMEAISAVSYGDYVRSSYFSTVYYIDMDEDGTLVRRPFMDAQTFMTWQSDWDDVGTITDATLPTMELGGPMLPKAGIVLVKIQSDARVFAIEGDGTIRWITSEAVAIANYGSNWADYVIDVAPTMFPRFTQGDDLDSDENGDTGIMKTRAVVNM